VDPVAYDEFGYFHENAEEFGLPYPGPPVVRRTSVPVDGTRSLSALVWGTGPPELVLLHGGGQNAHTWDTVALALGRPLVAIDLPGHGHSDGGLDPRLPPRDLAADVAVAVSALAPGARGVVGMSMGGMTALALADRSPELVRRLVLVDVTPGVSGTKASSIIAFLDGPPTFASFDDILARTIEHNPTRTEASLPRSIMQTVLAGAGLRASIHPSADETASVANPRPCAHGRITHPDSGAPSKLGVMSRWKSAKPTSPTKRPVARSRTTQYP